MRVNAWAAKAAAKPLETYTFELADPAVDEVQVKISHCGVCHSDLSMMDNAWGFSSYPLVPGHEIVGTVSRVGAHVKHLREGQTVGIGWFAGSCNNCASCMRGDQNLCSKSQPTIAGRPGGFASHINAQAAWALPIPDGVRPEMAGPLLCGGATVFNPFVQFDIRPTHRVGVVGVGGLGHMALQFANKWGCDVTAFTSQPDKKAQLTQLGAHHVVSSTDSKAWHNLAGHFDFILVTANAKLDWPALIKTLGPRGHLNYVGIVLEPIQVGVFDLLMGQRQLSASPTGSPELMRTMLDFAARHRIEPVCESYKMSDCNAALNHLREGKARYRIVLKNDL